MSGRGRRGGRRGGGRPLPGAGPAGTGPTSGPRREAGGSAIDALTARLADVSKHARIDIGVHAVLDFSALSLKPDHDRRPFWVTPTGSVFLEGE
jgi:hypothetical protein